MSRELLLARRLLEAIADPEAARQSVEDASSELAEILGRTGAPRGRGLPVTDFVGIVANDLSTHAWLLLLESRLPGDAHIPGDILSGIFWESPDPVIRFRLVSGGLHQDESVDSFDWLVAERREEISLQALPQCWPRDFLIALTDAAGPGGEPTDDLLVEFVLYLLQDGSPVALALAAAAIAPTRPGTGPAREILQMLIRAADPDMSDVGRYFSDLGI